jgi:type IV secretory pathway TrbD component
MSLTATATPRAEAEKPGSYRGWAIGGGVIAAVLIVGLVLWVTYHGW